MYLNISATTVACKTCQYTVGKLTFVYGSLVYQVQDRFLVAAIRSSWDSQERFSLASIKNDGHVLASLTCRINLGKRSWFKEKQENKTKLNVGRFGECKLVDSEPLPDSCQ